MERAGDEKKRSSTSHTALLDINSLLRPNSYTDCLYCSRPRSCLGVAPGIGAHIRTQQNNADLSHLCTNQMAWMGMFVKCWHNTTECVASYYRRTFSVDELKGQRAKKHSNIAMEHRMVHENKSDVFDNGFPQKLFSRRGRFDGSCGGGQVL